MTQQEEIEIELLKEDMEGHDELSRIHRKEADECARKITELRRRDEGIKGTNNLHGR